MPAGHRKEPLVGAPSHSQHEAHHGLQMTGAGRGLSMACWRLRGLCLRGAAGQAPEGHDQQLEAEAVAVMPVAVQCWVWLCWCCLELPTLGGQAAGRGGRAACASPPSGCIACLPDHALQNINEGTADNCAHIIGSGAF